MNRLNRRLRQLLAVVIFVPVIARASINSPIDGVVIDESTGKPIAGAFVIAQWVRYGSDGFGSRTSCPHVEVVQSDSQGRYRIPKTSVWGLGLTRMVFAYKAEYEWFVKGQEPEDRVMSMRPFKGTSQERLDKTLTMTRLECGPPEHYRIVLLPLYRSMLEEAKKLKSSDENIRGLRSMRYSLDVLELGYETARNKLMKGEYEE